MMSQTMKFLSLKAERKERGWSQAEVAEALGVNLSTVRRWERGRAVPYPYYRKKLATLFGKTTEELGLLWDIEENDAEEAVEEAPSPTAQSATPDVLIHQSSLVDPTIPQILGGANSLQGRNSLLIEMKQRLFAGDHLTLTALGGLPGIGKTSLVMALATDQEVQAHFRDGILWAGLGPRPKVLIQLARWGKLLGVAPSQVEDVESYAAWSQALRAAIGTRQMLLLLTMPGQLRMPRLYKSGGQRAPTY
ncbi:MAG TPA: helix-turn-helix transcriptional regulator [Ktedonobacteraceae bacterium]|jgi:transcriptional regulator with XRE-family HTH domain|nr:helix-turn-helix transcriptional regulator [Ktedonobacteraceae bacterium]